MTKLKTIYRLLVMLLVMPLFAGCEDDMFNNYGYYPEGTTMATLEARFEPFAATEVNSRAGVAPGNAMNHVSDLCLLAYDTDGNLMDGFPLEVTDYSVKNENRTNADASNGQSAEKSTLCLTKSNIQLPYGSYYLIAVANLGEYPDGSDDKINVKTTTFTALQTTFAGEYETLDDLRSMRVNWTNNNYRNNRQMLGYFTSDGFADGVPSAQSTFQRVNIRKANPTVKCWLRRVASKVTVDIDGSGLRENVNVYVRSVTIHNVPRSATLGFGKKAPENESDEWINFNNASSSKSDDNFAVSGHIVYFDDDNNAPGDYSSWPHIAKGSPYVTNPDGSRKDFHSESAPALYAFENMQGDAPNGKLQQADLVNGGVAGADTEFDGVPAGTYIEVEAYYEANASNNISKGTIKYRFMLGKDAEENCDFERNCHYKITLRLLGNANEYDWHVDYKETEGWEAPNPWYVSYLYNHKSTLPFKYTPKEGYEVVKVYAEIIHNPWEADNPKTWKMDPNNPDTLKKIKELQAEFCPPNDKLETYQAGNKQLGNGFLSLRETDKVIVTDKDCGYTFNGYDESLVGINDNYFFGRTGDKKINRARRIYLDKNHPDSVIAPMSDKEKFEMIEDKTKGKVTFNIPLFTRAKVLVKQTGYSGNNPFVGYTRTARIKLTALSEKKNADGTVQKDSSSFIVPVVQVRRVVNPKGVYRDYGNNEDFYVELLRLPGDSAETFQAFASDGPWKAEIIGDQNFITLDGRQTISGSTNDSISFTIKFNKLNKDRVTRNAVVRVLYHNYSCTHLIFVRQGYDPQQLTNNPKNSDGGAATYWNSFNMIGENIQADDPRDEGSLFKFGNTTGFDVIDNVYPDSENPDCHAPKVFKIHEKIRLADPNTGELLAGVPFSGITRDDGGFTTGKMANAATVYNFEELYRSDHLQFGYGVLYADGATATQRNYNDAYGYCRHDAANKKVGNRISPYSHKGMRGMFVYYWDEQYPRHECTARNVFFPIGRSGYGHRKEAKEEKGHEAKGMLRYCALGYGHRNLFDRSAPLFSTLYHRQGAIYYSRNKVDGSKFESWNGTHENGICIGLDINYFSFDVNTMAESNVSKGKDACFVRCITPASEMEQKKASRRRR